MCSVTTLPRHMGGNFTVQHKLRNRRTDAAVPVCAHSFLFFVYTCKYPQLRGGRGALKSIPMTICRVLRREGPDGRHCIFSHGQNATVPCHAANNCTSTTPHVASTTTAADTTTTVIRTATTNETTHSETASTNSDNNEPAATSKNTVVVTTKTTLMEMLRPNVEMASMVLYVVLGAAGAFACIAFITGMVICCKKSVSSALVCSSFSRLSPYNISPRAFPHHYI